MAPPNRPATPPTPSPSQLPPIPASPTYSYASTANPIAQFNLPLPPPPRPAHAVLTGADLGLSQEAYSELLASAKAYRIALATLGTAASSFGSALETCARLKEARAEPIGPLPAPGTLGSHDGSGPTAAGAAAATHNLSNSFVAGAAAPCSADPLLAISGVHHLVANHQQILSETVYRSFEVPLLHELDKWRREVDDENAGYEARAREQSREIRRLEKEGLKLHRQQRRRDVARFREHLVELTSKLDGLTSLHADHARTLLRECQETSARIADASCSLVRAEVDIFESLARKGWSGGGLDEVLEKGQDLFASAEEEQYGGGVGGGEAGSKIFSILPPKSILADSASDSAALQRAHGRSDSLTVDGTDQYQSLEGALSPTKGYRGGGETDSIFSEPVRGRGIIRPFSPQPIAVDPDEVMGPTRFPPPNQSTAYDDLESTPRPLATKVQRHELGGEDGNYDDPWKREDEGQEGSRASSIASSQRERRPSF